MINIVQGMTPNQFLSAMNNNNADLATNWNVDVNSFVTLITQKNSPDKINANLRNTWVNYGQKGGSYISALNNGFASIIHRFQDRIVPDVFNRGGVCTSETLSDDGLTMKVFVQFFCATTSNGIDFTIENTSGIPEGSDSSKVFKIGNTYFMTSCPMGNDPSHYWGTIHLYTSSDGLAWTDRGVIISYEGAGWESVSMGNSFLWIENTTWYLLYEARGILDSKGGIFNIGLATAPDVAGMPGTFTKYAGNPVIGNQPDLLPNPGSLGLVKLNNVVTKFNGRYYAYFHAAGYYVYRAYSTDLINWIIEGLTLNGRVAPLPGEQIGNATVCEFKGKSYMFYVNNSETGDQNQCIDMVVDNRSLTELIGLYP
jgi:hypothetical protein